MDRAKEGKPFSSIIGDTWFVRWFAVADKVFKLVGWALTIVAIQVIAWKTHSGWLYAFGGALQLFWMFTVQTGAYALINYLIKPVFADNTTARIVEFILASMLAIGLGVLIAYTMPALVAAALP